VTVPVGSPPSATGGAKLVGVLIEIGPVSRQSAVAWLDYAAVAVGELRSSETPRVPDRAIDKFEELVTQWRRAAARDGAFHWSADLPPEKVEFLMNALYSAGLEIERGAAEGRMTLRPAAADEFHIVMVQQVLDTLALQGGSNAEFVESLRNDWLIARKR
jgi:hypothetical protein